MNPEFPKIPNMTKAPDFDLRAMRDAVYGNTSTQNNWDACGPRWREDESWLTAAYSKMKLKNTVAAQPF